MKKKVRLLLFSLVILSIGIGVGYASSFLFDSKDILFDNTSTKLTSNNVQDAIDEITSDLIAGNATSANISSGKTAVVDGKLVTGTGADNTSNYNKGVQDADARVNTSSASYSKGVQDGSAQISTFISNFSGMNVAVCQGKGNCGGQTYEVSYAYNSSKVLKENVNPMVFGSLSYPYTNNVHWTEGNNGDGVYDCNWNVKYNVKAYDQVTGAEVGTSWPANYPNMLKIIAKWSFSPKGSGCSAYSFTDSVVLKVR